jgi:F-type H+-transporting ATPase subunit b
MPQLFHDPEFWVAVAGLVFVVLVWKPARRAILGSLDARAVRISQELDEAHRLREEAEQLLADYQRREREAGAEAEAIVTHAKAEAERIAERGVRELEQSLQRRQHLAEERIAQAEAKALDEIRAIAVDIAIAAARETLIAQLDERRGAQLLDTAIAALPQQLH